MALIENNLFAYDQTPEYDELTKKEMRRWITTAEKYFADNWDLTSEKTIFATAAKQPFKFSDKTGLALCGLAAAAGEFEFIKQHFYQYYNDPNTRKSESSHNFHALLPELKERWIKNGSIY
ncbi:hypothetical protein C2869_00125 [Saccharobesus litoralis]|uniref:Uncharacterized protein n=2 Tax=Saccharobesus litoralis TaxID=2172099 RepID=A0A2S0VL61_9ALTE|nr:hypothetical protein C2869_00125 [Saccharobesus litoralis]